MCFLYRWNRPVYTTSVSNSYPCLKIVSQKQSAVWCRRSTICHVFENTLYANRRTMSAVWIILPCNFISTPDFKENWNYSSWKFWELLGDWEIIAWFDSLSRNTYNVLFAKSEELLPDFFLLFRSWSKFGWVTDSWHSFSLLLVHCNLYSDFKCPCGIQLTQKQMHDYSARVLRRSAHKIVNVELVVTTEICYLDSNKWRWVFHHIFEIQSVTVQ